MINKSSPRYKLFEDKAKELGKTLLVEEYLISSKNIKVEENISLTESIVGESFTAFAILRNVPVTRYTENQNGRKYPKPLWERVMLSRIAEGSLCMADHPIDSQTSIHSGDGSVTHIAGVWHNFKLSENGGFADLYLVGSHGKLILETIRAGGKIGMSSVGFGELQEDMKTVNPMSYELSRLSDAVISPSQLVYATMENIKESNDIQSHSEYGTNLSDSKLFSEKHNTGIHNMSDTNEKLLKIQEANLRNQTTNLLKEANKISKSKNLTDMAEKLKEIKEAAANMPLATEKATLEAVAFKMEESIEAQTQSLQEGHADLSTKINDLQAKYDAASKLTEDLSKKYKKALEVIEKLGGNEANPEKLKMIEEMQDDIEKFQEDQSNMLEDLNVLKKERIDMLEDINIFKKERADMQSDISVYKEEIADRDSDLKNLNEDRKTMLEDIKQLVIDRKAMKEDLTMAKENIKLMNEDIFAAKKQLAENNVIGEDGAYDINDEEKIMEDFPVESDDNALESLSYEEPALNNMASAESTYRVENTGAKHRLVTRENVEPTFRKEIKEKTNPIAKELKAFYEDRVNEFPILEKVKNKILSARSLVEAVKISDAYTRNNDSDMVNLKESGNRISKTKWCEGYL